MSSFDWKSRKFLLTVAFVALVTANGIWNLGITENMLFAVAAVLGVYSGANAYESASNNPTINLSENTSRYEPIQYDGNSAEGEDA